MAAQTSKEIPNQHIIHEVRFFDTNHLHDHEEVDNADDMRPFTGKHID